MLNEVLMERILSRSAPPLLARNMKNPLKALPETLTTTLT
jgi:hypothetical protein